MTILLIIVLVILLIILALWLAGFLFATDFSVPVRDARQFRRVLVIFPHADDEAITCGGFLHRAARKGSAVTLALLTKGEKGPDATHASNLKELRTKEAQSVAAMLGISKLIQEDFGDGALLQKKQKLATYIAALIEQEKPNLLITYDRAGLYGHWDHITCSEIITELKATRFPEIPLWYVTLPKRILARVKMPEDVATDPAMRDKQAPPTYKCFIGASVLPKIRAWYTYKSQRVSLIKGIRVFAPIWFLWFFLSMVLFEYFAEAS
jgi:LmbE family N-acetylglucosaminyl deacetylase